MTRRVALVGPPDEPEIRALRQALEERGVSVAVWDSEGWPGEAPVELHRSERGARLRIAGDDAEGLQAVFLRNLGLDPLGERFADALDRRPVSLLGQIREYGGLLGSVLRRLERSGVRVINPTDAAGVHHRKPWQLEVLADAGLPVPETLTTNDPDAAAAFVGRLGEAVYKPVAGRGYARSLRAGELDASKLAKLANAPVQFQERIRGDNLRLYVVGGEVVAAGRIRSEALDYRLEDHDVEAVEPPAEVARAAARAASAMELPFAGVDVLDEGDRFVVLEVNPGPMFATFERLTGADVRGPLADLLHGTR